MRILSKILFFLIIALETIYSQPMLEWARSYNGPSNRYDVANAVIVDDSGYVYVTGYTQGTMTNNYDYCTIKYKPNGDSVWVRIFTTSTGSGFDIARDLKVDNLGNVYVTGTSATIKYDRFGNIVWQDLTLNTFESWKIELDNLGNVYIVGIFESPKPAIRKYSNNGILLWTTVYDTGTGYLYDMELNNNNIIAVGIQGVGTQGFFTMKCNSAGNILWTQRYAGNYPNYDEAHAVAVSSAGTIYVTGKSRDANNVDNYLTFKYDSSGTPLWFRRFGVGGALDIGLVNSEGVYVTGTSAFDYITIKYDTAGNLLWDRTKPSSFAPRPPSLVTDSEGGVYVAYNEPRNATLDLAIVKYNDTGIEQWVIRYPDSFPTSIVLDSNNLYSAGYGPGIGGLDGLTLKYSQAIGINLISESVPNKFKLYQNYPNPFNPETKIRFQVPKLSNVKVVIYDILGKEIKLLINESLSPGTYEINWNAELQPSGVFFCKLSAENAQHIIKLTLIK